MKRLINISILLFLLVLLNQPSTAHAWPTFCPDSPLCASWTRYEHCSFWENHPNEPSFQCDLYSRDIQYCLTFTDYCADGSSWTWKNLCILTLEIPTMEQWWCAPGTDNDGDGHQAISSCPPGDDCDDTDPTVYPGAREICDGKDNDCDGNKDETCIGCSENNTNMSSANLASGNLYNTQDILSSQGGLSLYLSYNSNDIYSGPLGKGWSHNYNINVTKITITQGMCNLECAISTRTYLSLMEANGQRVHFRSGGGNTYYPDVNSEEHSTIIENADDTFTMTTKEGKTYNFNSAGQLTSIKDRNNNTTTLTYTDGKLTSITDPVGRVTTITYDASNRIAAITDHIGRVTILSYDANGYLSTVTDPANNTYSYTYDANGKMLTKTDPRGNTTTYVYDSYGKVLTSTNSSGTKTISYNQVTNVATITERDGSVRTHKYDPVLNVPIEVTNPQGGITTYVYDQSRNLTSETDPSGNTTSYTYDSLGNMTSMTDPMGNITAFIYNGLNQITSITDPMANITTYTYDANGNLLNTTDPIGNTTTMTYDSHGWLMSMTDPKGNITQYTYDEMGRMASVTDPLGKITQYSYNLDDKLTMVTDAKNHSIGYEYDQLGRVTTMTDQLGGIETYSYDTFGNIISTTDRKGQTTIYSYDQLNRITQATYADGSFTTYTYDTLGKLITITDSVSGTISYTYASSGCGAGCSGGSTDKIINETTPQGSISYTYDAIGRRESMTVAGQPIVNYGYDANSRLTSVVGAGLAPAQISYDASGRRTSLTLPNGVITNYTYDDASRLLNLEHLDPLSQILESLSYTYDNNGNRTNMNRVNVNLPSPNPASGIAYNEANQMLTFIPSAGSAKNMTYDENGNMTTITNGCGTTTYTWDARNRLVGINGFNAQCSSLSASFKYDALGRRIEKTINGRTFQYLYDGVDIVQEIENGQVTVNYIRTLNIDEPLARIKADGTVRYYQSDALGSIISLTTENGQLSTVYTYDPFGNVTIAGEPSDNPFQYTGRENDGTGLYYYRARYYSPELQRFISEDPIGLAGGINKFVYTGNNPLRKRDPLGLYGESWSPDWPENTYKWTNAPPDDQCRPKKCNWVKVAACVLSDPAVNPDPNSLMTLSKCSISVYRYIRTGGVTPIDSEACMQSGINLLPALPQCLKDNGCD